MVQVIGQLDLLLGTQLALRLPDIDPTVSLRAPIWPACLAFLPVHARLTALDRMAVDLQVGTVAMTIACNEMLEPLRLPLVVVSTPAVVRILGYK